MGSDEFSVPSLETCLQETDVVAVYTRPDRRAGRGRRRLAASPVKTAAVEHGLRIEQPETFDNKRCEELRELGPDLLVVAAYGLILPAPALQAARVDSINVHASLLPRHRGAAPIAAAIRAGDDETGVTIMKLRPELDAGEFVCLGDARRAQARVRIRDGETAGELTGRLALLGGRLLAEVIAAYAEGSVTYEPQDGSKATYAPMLSKADGRIDWTWPADRIVRHVRAMTPWPSAFGHLLLPDQPPRRVVILEARVGERCSGRPGTVQVVDGALVVRAGEGCVEIVRLKPAGRKAMEGDAFIRGCQPLRDGKGRDGECRFATD
ncbi:MAG: methionyl-tRNA formyltransferase [Planctomycetota bacterium]